HDKDGKRDISLSTQAMCCVAICRLLKADDEYSFLHADDEDLRTDLDSHFKRTVEAVLDRLKEDPHLSSSTYGPDDVFTASWLLLLYDKASKTRSVFSKPPDWPDAFKDNVVQIIAKAI